MELLTTPPQDAAERAPDAGAGRLGAGVKMPTVAAIVCNYNQEAYVEAAIASVARQTYPYLECVVVDDCSTDGSSEVISRVLADPGMERFRFIRHAENRGQMAAMMSGLDATTAPFVAWLDADDLWLPQFVERHIAHHLNSQINAAISTSNLAVIDAGSTVIAGATPSMSSSNPLRERKRALPLSPARLIPSCAALDHAAGAPAGPIFINRQYESWVWSPTSGMFFRRATVEAIRPMDVHKLRICADNYLARFSHVVGGTIWMGETLGCYRIHGKNNFSKRTVHGDGPLGRTCGPIAREGNYQFARKMLESGTVLLALIPKHIRSKLVRKIGRKDAVHLILANGELLKGVSPRVKGWLIMNHAIEKCRRLLAKSRA